VAVVKRNAVIFHYIDLAFRSFRKNFVLTALMVVAIALGIGTSMTALTTFHVLSGDPIPEASKKLFYPQLDPRPMKGYSPGESPEVQMTRFDAEMLLRGRQADRQAMMTAGTMTITSQTTDEPPFNVSARYTSSDFFQMFRVPFLYGNYWGATEDDGHGRVAVISKSLNDSLFKGVNSIGSTIVLNQKPVRIVGVIDEWRMTPRFYDLSARKFGDAEKVFIPFSTAIDMRAETVGSTSCWRDPGEDAYALNSPCTWVQYWVELGSQKRVEEYIRYLANYSEQQRQSGRFERPSNTRLFNVTQWLDDQRVVPSDIQLQLLLSFAFLGVCIVNMISLLLAKFLRRSSEFAIRRALGASRFDVFMQCIVEAGCIGLAGGGLGLVLALGGLWMIRQQPSAYAKLAHLDSTMLLATFLVAILSSLLAGLIPAWRVSGHSPAFRLNEK
jgi:putative ABC transport system permease protein